MANGRPIDSVLTSWRPSTSPRLLFAVECSAVFFIRLCIPLSIPLGDNRFRAFVT